MAAILRRLGGAPGLIAELRRMSDGLDKGAKIQYFGLTNLTYAKPIGKARIAALARVGRELIV